MRVIPMMSVCKLLTTTVYLPLKIEKKKPKTDHNKEWGPRREKVPAFNMFLSWLALDIKHRDMTTM